MSARTLRYEADRDDIGVALWARPIETFGISGLALLGIYKSEAQAFAAAQAHARERGWTLLPADLVVTDAEEASR